MKCIVCDREAIGKLTLDMDMHGIRFCEEHRSDVQIFMYFLMTESEDAAEKYLNSCKKRWAQSQVKLKKESE